MRTSEAFSRVLTTQCDLVTVVNEMRYVYTDKRLPGLEIVNEDSNTIDVCANGKKVTYFETYENPSGTLSEAFVARRAKDYFDRQSRMEAYVDIPDELDHSEIFNNEPRKPTEQEISSLMAKEKLEAHPVRKQALRRRILNMMRQQESAAESIAAHLLDY